MRSVCSAPSGQVLRTLLLDQSQIPPKPIAEKEFVAREFDVAAVPAVENEGLGVQACDGAFAGREEFFEFPAVEIPSLNVQRILPEMVWFPLPSFRFSVDVPALAPL